MTETVPIQIAIDRKITILIAEDRKLVRDTWRFILERDDRFKIVAECDSPELAIFQVKKLHPDIIILEIRPPGLSGMEMMPLIRKFSSGSNVLAVSVYTVPNVALELVLAGASGYLTKTSTLDEASTAMMQIMKGETYLSRELRKTNRKQLDVCTESSNGLGQLTLRELEIAVAIKNGWLVSEIAEDLRISATSVDMYCYRILKKLRLKEVADLSDYFQQCRQMVQ